MTIESIIRYTFILPSVLMLCLVSSCSKNDDDNGIKNDIVGEWYTSKVIITDIIKSTDTEINIKKTDSEYYFVKFKEDNTVEFTYYINYTQRKTVEYSYSINGNVVTVKASSSMDFVYNKKGQTLSLEYYDDKNNKAVLYLSKKNSSKSSVPDGDYTDQVASFSFDFQYGHTQSYLYPALNSSNYFCFFSTNPIDGGYDLITEAYGTKEKNVEHITEAVLTKRVRILGLNNGLIAGRSSSQNGELYVFDRQCPNCFNETNTTNFPLNFNDASSVYCNSCKRTYGLLNGGVVTSDPSSHKRNEKLFRYRATCSGTYFQVTNE